VPVRGLRRDPALTWGGIDVLCNESTPLADRFRGLFTGAPKPPATDFTVGLGLDWHHGLGASNFCGFLMTTPAQAGATATGTLKKPDGSSETKTFKLDSSGYGLGTWGITSYGGYHLDASVTVGTVTKTASADANVTSTPGKDARCPAP
jgi:hypothetical protein